MAKDKKVKKKGKVSKKSDFMCRLEDLGAKIIFVLDILLDKLEVKAAEGWVKFRKLMKLTLEKLMDAGAAIVTWIDHVLAVISWMMTKMFIGIVRRIYNFRMELKHHAREILEGCA